MPRSLSRFSRSLHAASRAASVLAGVAACGHAFAQTEGSSVSGGDGLNAGGRSPFYYGASIDVTRDSNIFRARKGDPETSDTYTTLSLLAGLDQPFGRQRVTASAAISHNSYQDLSRLDNTGYTLGAALDWQTIEKLSGNLSVVAKEGLARYGIESAPTTTEKNVEKARSVDATVQYGGESILTLYGLYGYRSLGYSLDAFEGLGYERNEFGVGLRYRVSGALRVGVEGKFGQGKFGPDTATPDEFDRTDLALTATWDPTGASSLRARIAASKQDRDIGSDFSGITGSVGWLWRPTGKLLFDTDFRRDIGQEVDRIVASNFGAIGDNSRVTNALQLRAEYRATAKIRVDLTGRYARRSLVDTVATLSSAGSDTTTTLRLGAQYDVLRAVTVGCSVGREDRSADSIASFSYTANTASCFARLLLR